MGLTPTSRLGDPLGISTLGFHALHSCASYAYKQEEWALVRGGSVFGGGVRRAPQSVSFLIGAGGSSPMHGSMRPSSLLRSSSDSQRLPLLRCPHRRFGRSCIRRNRKRLSRRNDCPRQSIAGDRCGASGATYTVSMPR